MRRKSLQVSNIGAIAEKISGELKNSTIWTNSTIGNKAGKWIQKWSLCRVEQAGTWTNKNKGIKQILCHQMVICSWQVPSLALYFDINPKHYQIFLTGKDHNVFILNNWKKESNIIQLSTVNVRCLVMF